MVKSALVAITFNKVKILIGKFRLLIEFYNRPIYVLRTVCNFVRRAFKFFPDFRQMVKTVLVSLKTQNTRKLICAKVALNADGAHRQHLFFEKRRAMLAKHIDVNSVKLFLCAFKLRFIRVGKVSVRAQNVNRKSGAGKRVSHNQFFVQSERAPDTPHFIFIQFFKRLDDQSLVDKRLDSLNTVMVRFYCVRVFCAAGLNNIGVQRSLCQKPVIVA